VVCLHSLYWDGEKGGLQVDLPSMQENRDFVLEQFKKVIREDHIRAVYPTPYKISLSSKLYDYFHNHWEHEAPIRQLS